jgi:hypothetical protein
MLAIKNSTVAMQFKSAGSGTRENGLEISKGKLATHGLVVFAAMQFEF